MPQVPVGRLGSLLVVSAVAVSGCHEGQPCGCLRLDRTIRRFRSWHPTCSRRRIAASRRRPTYLGIHKYDDKLEDYSRAGCHRSARGATPAARLRIEAVDPATLSPRQTARSRAAAARDRFADSHARRHPAVGEGSRHLQQRPHQHRLHHDQAQLRAAEERLRAAHRAREGDAGRARRGAEEPRESAAHLRRDRDRAARRQPRLLQDRRGRRRSRTSRTRRCVASSRQRTTPSSRRSATTRSGCRRTCCSAQRRLRLSAPTRTGRSSAADEMVDTPLDRAAGDRGEEPAEEPGGLCRDGEGRSIRSSTPMAGARRCRGATIRRPPSCSR